MSLVSWRVMDIEATNCLFGDDLEIHARLEGYLTHDGMTKKCLTPNDIKREVETKLLYGLVTEPTPKIRNVIFNPPATIILWTDNTKSVVQCQNGEPFDPEKGFALAYLKKLLGNKNEFNKEIHKWVWED